MAELVRYRGQVTSKSNASNLQPVATCTVLVTKRGVTADGQQTVAGGGNLTLHAGGQRFAANDVIQIERDITTISKITSVTSDTVVVITTGFTIEDGERLINLGADSSGGTGTPQYDGYVAAETIYSDPSDAGTVATGNKVTTDADGEYGFWAEYGVYDINIMDSSTQLGSGSQTLPDEVVGHPGDRLGTQVIIVDGVRYPANDVGINMAIQEVFALGGGKVFLPPGTYTLDAAIDIEENIWLQGAGPETIITPSATFPAPVGNATDGLIRTPNDNGDIGPPKYNLSAPGEYLKISDMKLDIKFSTTARSVSSCMQIFGMLDVIIDSVWCLDGDTFGITVGESKRTTISNCHVRKFTHGANSNGIGISGGGASQIQGYNATIVNNVVEDIGTIGINLRSMENATITGNSIRSCVNGIDVEGDLGSGAATLGPIQNVTISGNTLIGTTDTNVSGVEQDKRAIVLWLRDTETSTDTDLVNYNINITGNTIKDYDTALEASGGHWNFSANNIYNYGNGGASSSGVKVGNVFSTDLKMNNFAIVDNYFQQTTRALTGTVGAIQIDAGTVADIDNVIIRGNIINGQDLSGTGATQFGIFIQTAGDNWDISDNYFRETTNQPIRMIAENVGAPSNWRIANNYFLDCNHESGSSAQATMTLSDSNNLTWSKIVIAHNTVLDANSNTNYLVATTGTGWTGALVLKDNYCPDNTIGLHTGTVGDVLVQQGNIDLNTLLDIQSDTQGGRWVAGMNMEEITLNTGGTTTDSTANLLPANSLIQAVTARVTTTITTAVNYDLGDATDGTRFITNHTGVTAGNNVVATEHHGEATTSGVRQGSGAAKLRITTNANPGAGVVRVVVYYHQFIAPAG